MTLQELLSDDYNRYVGYRRRSWSKGKHIREVNPDCNLVFYRFANSSITWNWTPNVYDILATDWEPYYEK